MPKQDMMTTSDQSLPLGDHSESVRLQKSSDITLFRAGEATERQLGGNVKNPISQETIGQVLEWGYDKAISGIAGLSSAEELAQSYMKNDLSPYQQVNSLIKFQNAKATTSGFLSGLGGLITLPVTLPANITSVLYVQIRMIAAIAHIGGYDIRDDRVKTMIYSCLVASSAKEVVKNFGLSLGNKAAISAIKSIPGKTLTAINQKVGFRLVTKFGEKGVINLGKTVLILGGLIGGSVDLYATNKIGKVARDTFIAVAEEKYV